MTWRPAHANDEKGSSCALSGSAFTFAGGHACWCSAKRASDGPGSRVNTFQMALKHEFSGGQFLEVLP